MIKERLVHIFFFLLLGFFLYFGGSLLAPYFGPMLFSVITGIVLYPLYTWLGKQFPKRSPAFRSIVMVGAVFIFLVIPIALVVGGIIGESDTAIAKAHQGIDAIKAWAHRGPSQWGSWWDKLPAALQNYLDEDRLQEWGASMAKRGIGSFAVIGTALAKNTVGFLWDLFIFLFVLFFIFRDGSSFEKAFFELVPMRVPDKKQLVQQIKETLMGVMRGNFLTALVQTMTAVLGYFVVGADAIILLGTITFLASFIPAVGTVIVWLPMAIYYLATGTVWKGVFLVVWGGAVVGTVDNFLRPLLIGQGKSLPFFWLFFAITGGIQVFGLKGLVLGPVILAVIPVMLKIYKEHYL